MERLLPKALTAVVAALLIVGCSSATTRTTVPQPKAPVTPQGYVQLRGPGYAIAHPADWTQSNTTDEQGFPMVEAHGAPGTDGAYRGQVIVSRRDHYNGTMQTELDQVRMLNTVTKRQVVADATAAVPGAQEAHRIEAVYDEPSPSGATVRIRIVDLYVLTPAGTMLDVTGRAAEADFESARVRTVLGTLWVTS